MIGASETRRRIRFTPEEPCPICDGHDLAARGQGVRCHGYRVEGGGIYCARIESAKPNNGGDLFWHPRSQGVDRRWTDGKRVGSVGRKPPKGGRVRRGPRIWVDGDWDRIWSYEDPDGRVLFQICRKDATEKFGKQIRPRRPNTKKQPSARNPDFIPDWLPDLTNVPMVPLFWPELQQAINSGSPVELWIAEGEKDAQALRDAGVLASTWHGGAKRWSKAREHCVPVWSQFPKVTIFADNDPEGAEVALAIARDLQRAAPDIEVHLARIPEGGDE